MFFTADFYGVFPLRLETKQPVTSPTSDSEGEWMHVIILCNTNWLSLLSASSSNDGDLSIVIGKYALTCLHDEVHFKVLLSSS